MSFKKKLKSKKTLIGSWITLPNNSIAEIMSKCGFDWLAIDMEHSAISIQNAEELIRVIDLCNVQPIVRLTSINKNQIKRMMDAGAKGIIVPMVNSLSDIEEVVSYLRYPPLGNRSVGLARAQGYGSNFAKYLETEKRDISLIIQIEHTKAVENIDEIFSSKHIDAFLIGPYDLSASLGTPGDFQSLKYKNAIKKINQAARKFNIASGIHIIDPSINQLKKVLKEKYTFVAYSLDIRVIDFNYRKALKEIKKIK